MFEALLAGLFGLLIGSFLNVCIYRWPRDLSVVAPRSSCPACDAPIGWYDNIPVLSFLALRGKCRRCSGAISWRYPLVEALTGFAFFWLAAMGGIHLNTVRDAIFVAILIALTFADLETRLLPDELTLGGLLIGLTLAWFAPLRGGFAAWLLSVWDIRAGTGASSLVEALLGAFIPSASLWLLGVGYEKFRQREGLGFGDVKMLAMMGAFLGFTPTLLALIAGSLLGSILGLLYILITRKQMNEYQLPFGVFLAIGGLFSLFAGAPLLRWYQTFW